MHLERKYKVIGLKSAFAGVFVLLFFANCEQPPEFSKTPEIKFNNLVSSTEFDPLRQIEINKLTISLDFTDGDGDLGVLASDVGNLEFRSYADTTFVPADTSTVDGVMVVTPERTIFTFKNYYLNFLRKQDGVFEKVETASSFDGTFDPLIPYDELGPIEGVLDFEFQVDGGRVPPGFQANDTIVFEVYIVDRALNESNRIQTSEIILF